METVLFLHGNGQVLKSSLHSVLLLHTQALGMYAGTAVVIII
jgi:hypothetical protein